MKVADNFILEQEQKLEKNFLSEYERIAYTAQEGSLLDRIWRDWEITDISDTALTQWRDNMIKQIAVWCDEIREDWEFENYCEFARKWGILIYKG